MASRPQITITFLLVVTTVIGVSAACGAYLVRASAGQWREMIWYSPLTAAAPLMLMTLLAIGTMLAKKLWKT